MKYTDEELSRILSAHEGGQLYRPSHRAYSESGDEIPWPRSMCANMAAYESEDWWSADRLNILAAGWFDNYYRPEMSADDLLTALEFRT